MLDKAGHEITMFDDEPIVITTTQRLKTICECKSHDSQIKNMGSTRFADYPCQLCQGRGFIYKTVTFYAPPEAIKDDLDECKESKASSSKDKQASGKVPRGRRPKSTPPALSEQAS